MVGSKGQWGSGFASAWARGERGSAYGVITSGPGQCEGLAVGEDGWVGVVGEGDNMGGANGGGGEEGERDGGGGEHGNERGGEGGGGWELCYVNEEIASKRLDGCWGKRVKRVYE